VTDRSQCATSWLSASYRIMDCLAFFPKEKRCRGVLLRRNSAIDLVLTSAELAEEVVTCGIHPTKHGPDHRAIRLESNLDAPNRGNSTRRMFKDAPWVVIRASTGPNLGPDPITSSQHLHV
jgi:hypothetical protein